MVSTYYYEKMELCRKGQNILERHSIYLLTAGTLSSMNFSCCVPMLLFSDDILCDMRVCKGQYALGSAAVCDLKSAFSCC